MQLVGDMRCGEWVARLAILCAFGLAAVCSCEGREDTDVTVRLSSGPVVSVHAARKEREPPLRFVFASVLSPERSLAPYARFAAYLTTHLGQPVEMVRRRTYAELNELLREGEAQAGLVCSGAYAVGRESFGLREIVVPVVQGKLSYRAYVIARRTSSYRSLDDLEGRTFAFSDPLSNTGYRYVAAILRERGKTPRSYFGRTFFTYSHDNSIQAVRDGIADASTVDSLIWDQLVREDRSLAQELRIIGTSQEFPINPIVISPRAEPALARRLSGLLLSMSSDALGEEVLDELGIERFTKLADERYDLIAASWRDLGVIDGPRLRGR